MTVFIRVTLGATVYFSCNLSFLKESSLLDEA
jgi:hypothetical protein